MWVSKSVRLILRCLQTESDERFQQQAEKLLCAELTNVSQHIKSKYNRIIFQNLQKFLFLFSSSICIWRMKLLVLVLSIQGCRKQRLYTRVIFQAFIPFYCWLWFCCWPYAVIGDLQLQDRRCRLLAANCRFHGNCIFPLMMCVFALRQITLWISSKQQLLAVQSFTSVSVLADKTLRMCPAATRVSFPLTDEVIKRPDPRCVMYQRKE